MGAKYPSWEPEVNRARAAAWYADPGNRARVSFRERLRKYAVSEDGYWAMLRGQSYSCHVCGGLLDFGKTMAIDHDHANGKVRALLHTKCNYRVGLIERGYDLAARAYLESFNA